METPEQSYKIIVVQSLFKVTLKVVWGGGSEGEETERQRLKEEKREGRRRRGEKEKD